MDYNGTQYRPGTAGRDPLPPYAPDDEFKAWYSQRTSEDEIDCVWEEREKEQIKCITSPEL